MSAEVPVGHTYDLSLPVAFNGMYVGCPHMRVRNMPGSGTTRTASATVQKAKPTYTACATTEMASSNLREFQEVKFLVLPWTLLELRVEVVGPPCPTLRRIHAMNPV